MIQKLRELIAAVLEWQVRRLIKAKQPLIVGITGSVGKTTTKLAIAHLLSAKYKILAHAGNYNSQIGLPVAIFEQELPSPLYNPLAWFKIFWHNETKIRADYPYQVWVLELGADQPDDIAKFTCYLQPDVGVVTAVKPVHTEQFGSVEAVMKEKWLLAQASKNVLLNAEDERLMAKKAELSQPVLTYGVSGGDVRFQELTAGSEGLAGELVIKDQILPAKTHLIAHHSLLPLSAAAAVAYELDVDAKDMVKQIESWRPVKGRMNPLPGKRGSLIIDDSYNSSPDAAIAALDALYDLEAPGRKIAVLGSMNELGDFSHQGHEQVGAHSGRLDLLVTIGGEANERLAPAALKAGLRLENVKRFISPYEAGQFVAANLQQGDVVLVKGSQNKVFAEEAIKYMLADTADEQYLVRQTPDWLKKKGQQFGR